MGKYTNILRQASEADIRLERRIIVGMITSDEYLSAISSSYKSDLIEATYYRIIARWCMSYFKKYGRAPGKQIQSIYESHSNGNGKGLDPETAEEIHDLLVYLNNQNQSEDEELDVSYLTDETEKRWKARELKLLAEDISAYVDNGHISDAEELIEEFSPTSIASGKTELIKQLESSIVCATDFVEEKIKRPKVFLKPWLTAASLTMVYGPRGVGKTLAGMTIGVSVTRKDDPTIEIGPWSTRRNCGCLYIDSEMSEFHLQDRLKRLVGPLGEESTEHPLYFLSSNRFAREYGRQPNLTQQEWRDCLYDFISGRLDTYQLLFLDNISALTPGIDENLKQGWDEIGQWLIRLRHLGLAVILIHHSGKSGQQRGTSGREDALDTVIKLTKPEGYQQHEDGAMFNVEFEKARNAAPGDDMKPFQLRICEHPENHKWLTWESSEIKPKTNLDTESIMALSLDGQWSQKQIAEQFTVTQGRVSQIKRQALGKGYVDDKGKVTATGRIFIGKAKLETFYEE